MGETEDGSGSAHSDAQGEHEQDQRGIFARLLGLKANGHSGHATPPFMGSALTVPKTHGLLNLRRMRIEDVSVPTVEIVSVPDDIGKDDLIRVFRESGFSRLPVFHGTLDSPVGLVHLKDVALSHGFNGGDKPFSLQTLLRPLLFAPPSMPLGVLLQKMQTERTHMALVIDEYGGVDGLVTIEDLIEQVIGDIEDEHDVEEAATFLEEKPGCYVAKARTPLDEFEAAIGQSLRTGGLDEEEIDTLGGLVFVLSGRVPARGEVVLHPDGVEFEVIDADPRHIKRMRVRITGRTPDA